MRITFGDVLILAPLTVESNTVLLSYICNSVNKGIKIKDQFTSSLNGRDDLQIVYTLNTIHLTVTRYIPIRKKYSTIRIDGKSQTCLTNYPTMCSVVFF